jgi:uncharacterized protein DUF4845
MQKQRGVTMIGWIFLLIPVAIVLYAGIRVGPHYFNYYKILTAMKETATQLKSDETLAPLTIVKALEKRFDTGYIDNISAQNDVHVAMGDKGWEMTVDYEATEPMFGNLYLTLVFKKTVAIN